ncbi:MAG: hypothetical protein ISS65_08695 [Desulfobacterales bacterium]|uniref:Uncharacterized protein n=1 Tax=Candidatus Desulfatibia profunda TaxID=2841695 RepID=A0A8J6NU70_9BACT|nr:hypothetical protein [Candidatus Desulfatibia profunda]MBL7180268.1 hypothetical protein [Desulfobacterales bacterium]
MGKIKDTLQGNGNQEYIKRFSTGVVSYSLFADMYENRSFFMGRLDFMVDCANETGEFEKAMDLIHLLIEQGHEENESFWDKGKSEKGAAGGNFIMTIKDEVQEKSDKLLEGMLADANKEIERLKADLAEKRKALAGEVQDA